MQNQDILHGETKDAVRPFFTSVICGLIFINNRFVEYILFVLDAVMICFIRGGADYGQHEYLYRVASCSSTELYQEPGFQLLCIFCRDTLHLSCESFRFLIGFIAIVLIYSTIRRYTSSRALALALMSMFPFPQRRSNPQLFSLFHYYLVSAF